MQVYVSKDGQQYGPYTTEQLRDCVQQGNFTEGDHACHDGQNWVTVAEVPGFAGGDQSASAPDSPATPLPMVQEQTSATGAAPKKKKNVLWSSIGGAVALLLAGLWVWQSSKEEDADESQLSDASEEDIEAAKKKVAEARAKAGAPESDLAPNFDQIMAEENRVKKELVAKAEKLLAKAQKDAANGQYQLAHDQIDEALSMLPRDVSTISLVTTLYEAKLKIISSQLLAAKQNGDKELAAQLQLGYERTEAMLRDEETIIPGIPLEEPIELEEIEIKEEERLEQQMARARQLQTESRNFLAKKNYSEAEKRLFSISNDMEPNRKTWPIIREAAIELNRINLLKAEDARQMKDWSLARMFIEEFQQSFYQSRNLVNNHNEPERSGLTEKERENELALALPLEKRIEQDLKDPANKQFLQTDGTPKPTTYARDLQLAKMKRIEIPGVHFFDTPLEEVLTTLMSYSRQNDFAEPDPAAKGVNIIAMLQGHPSPHVTIQLNKMTLGKMLDFITEMVGWTYEIRDDAIVVSKGVQTGPAPDPFGPGAAPDPFAPSGGRSAPDPFGPGAAGDPFAPSGGRAAPNPFNPPGAGGNKGANAKDKD